MAEDLAEEDWQDWADIEEEKTGQELNEENDTDEYDPEETYFLTGVYGDEWKTEKQLIEDHRLGILDEFTTYFPKEEWVNHFDVDEAAQDAVDSDGWAHFISLYDGDYEEIEDGYINFRE